MTAQDKSAGWLDLADIQGNILNAYGKLGFPKGRVILLHVHNGDAGREFVHRFYPRVTTALRWPSSKPQAAPPSPDAPVRPDVTLNLAFTFWGLFALGVPVSTLSRLPPEFADGMRARAAILGDDIPKGALNNWDKVWRHESEANGPRNVHIMALLNSDMDPATGEPVAALEALTEDIRTYCRSTGGGMEILEGHGAGPKEYQELSALLDRDERTGRYSPSAHEHFGFFDGISDPVFKGQFPPDLEALRCVGNGKIDDSGKWHPLETGEFLLGYPDEAKEVPPAAPPNAFSANATFMAYRKLHQNVALFDDYVTRTVPEFGQVYGIADPVEARATLMAKFAGRWGDGVPLVLAPTYADWQAFNAANRDPLTRFALLSQYDYAGDPTGSACPPSSHTRRVHPRDSLGPEPAVDGKCGKSGTNLVNRRRILRRGLPYKIQTKGRGLRKATEEQGIVMLICCASLSRQYEFVQQQWLNYGMDNNAGNDTCPMLGARPETDLKFVIPTDPERGTAPYICANLPQFVETRGGAYFFVPSMTALRMIALGMIDPT